MKQAFLIFLCVPACTTIVTTEKSPDGYVRNDTYVNFMGKTEGLVLPMGARLASNDATEVPLSVVRTYGTLGVANVLERGFTSRAKIDADVERARTLVPVETAKIEAAAAAAR